MQAAGSAGGLDEFDESVDRIVSIGAFEHFGPARYRAFFEMAYNALPQEGVALLHTIVRPDFKDRKAAGLALTHELIEFSRFILAEVFPNGWLPALATVQQRATQAGFSVTRAQSLQPHYARTLDTWAARLRVNKAQAIAVQSEEVYERYMTYLTGCAELFRDGYTDVKQFTLVKQPQ